MANLLQHGLNFLLVRQFFPISEDKVEVLHTLRVHLLLGGGWAHGNLIVIEGLTHSNSEVSPNEQARLLSTVLYRSQVIENDLVRAHWISLSNKI